MSDEVKILELTDFLREMAKALIACGCSSNRVENLLVRLGHIFEFDVNVLALPTGCSLAVRKDGQEKFDLIRIKDWGINLNQLSMINDLVNQLEEKKLTIAQARRQLAQIILERPPYSDLLSVLAGGWASAGLVFFYGGSYLEMSLAFVIGIFVMILRGALNKGENSRYLVDYLSAAAVAFGASLAHYFLPEINIHRVITGGIIMMVPGLVFVNAIHEVSQKNLVSGAAKAFEAIVVALSLAFGVITIVGIAKFLGL